MKNQKIGIQELSDEQLYQIINQGMKDYKFDLPLNKGKKFWDIIGWDAGFYDKNRNILDLSKTIIIDQNNCNDIFQKAIDNLKVKYSMWDIVPPGKSQRPELFNYPIAF